MIYLERYAQTLPVKYTYIHYSSNSCGLAAPYSLMTIEELIDLHRRCFAVAHTKMFKV